MGWLWRFLMWFVILGITAMLAVAVLIPRVAGATPYVVLTGSMTPSMPPGTMVVAKPVDARSLGIGSVITYQLRSGQPTVVTHRIVAMSNTPDGRPIFRTKGDANDVPDKKWVRPVQIKGERWYAVPYLGYATTLITSGQRHIALIVIVAGLIGYAASMFIAAGRDRFRDHSSSMAKGESP